jgi:murein DD-endopeptidase MepM/ murein hydrolase activator NlpD
MRLRCALAIVILTSSAAAAATSGTNELKIAVRARAIAPGEPVRLIVDSAQPLTSLEGEFLEQAVYMERTVSPEGKERWTGWGMVGLNETARATTVEVRGVSVSGGEIAGTYRVEIEPRDFPEERLDVESKYVEPPPEVQSRLTREREKLSRVYANRDALRTEDGPFVRPVPGEPTSIFGTRRIFNGKPRSPHPGLDLRAAEGTEVRASGPGKVVIAQDLYYSGNIVILDHGGGLFTLYAHLSELRVAEGDAIAAGQTIGLSGSTGRVTGPHLHWGAKIGNHPFDPRALLDPALF